MTTEQELNEKLLKFEAIRLILSNYPSLTGPDAARHFLQDNIREGLKE